MKELKAGDWLFCVKTSQDKSVEKGKFYQVKEIQDANTMEMMLPLRGVWTPPDANFFGPSLFVNLGRKEVTNLELIIYGVTL